MPLYLGNKLVSGQSRPIDANPIEGSENLISSGGVKTYVDEKIAGHVSDATIHVTEEEKAAWNGKQPKITANGLLKGDGNGGVSAAAAGTDYAAASHNHDSSYLKLSGGKLTGNLTGKYITGTWLQTTESTALGSAATKICVLDSSGWVYYRTPAQILSDIGAIPTSAKGAVSGVATLGTDGKVPTAQLPEMNYASSTHAGQHAIGGADPITPAAIGAAPAYTYGTEDLTAGSSALETGKLYFVYE